MCVKEMVLGGEVKKKVALRLGENEAEIDFVYIPKEHRWFLRRVISGHFETCTSGSRYRQTDTAVLILVISLKLRVPRFTSSL